MSLIVHALPGFLGRPDDWDFLKEALPGLRAWDPCRILSPAEGASLPDWARSFNARIAAEEPKSLGRALIGYSMGGRLALHALLDAPHLWRSAVIISANPGLPEGAPRRERIESDEHWARRFERDSWELLIRAWNGLELFNGRSSNPARQESDYRRADLAGSFRAWSLGRQGDLLEALSRLEIPLLWVAGERDARFRELASRVAERRREAGAPTELWIAPGAAHRVPWDAPRELARRILDFLGCGHGCDQGRVRNPVDQSG